mmetsp:Transcript_35626/g.60049  ORF Transcript_35626/g.60049 Transcript_35626/m.60049 type:complete len:521 (+) Transcript_35626:327-1889(+)
MLGISSMPTLGAIPISTLPTRQTAVRICPRQRQYGSHSSLRCASSQNGPTLSSKDFSGKTSSTVGVGGALRSHRWGPRRAADEKQIKKKQRDARTCASAAAAAPMPDGAKGISDGSAEGENETLVSQFMNVVDSLYPPWMDYFPALMGKINPITGLFLYFTGFVMVESQRMGSMGSMFQWVFLVLLPVHSALAALKFWWFKRGLRKKGEDLTNARRQWLVLQRSAWIDFHFCAQLLVPAGMSGHENADFWLFMVPIFMAFRFLWSLNWPPLAKVLFWINRVGAFVLLIPSTVVLLMYGFKGLMGSVTALHASGFYGVFALPFSLGLTYVMYVAPVARIPAALATAWKGDRKAAAQNAIPTEPLVELTPEEKAAAKREKIGWAIAYVVATIATSMLGNDIPFFVLMGMQLIKQSPDKLMQALIDKGDRSSWKRGSKAKLWERLDDRTEWIRSFRARLVKAERDNHAKARGSFIGGTTYTSAEVQSEAQAKSEALAKIAALAKSGPKGVFIGGITYTSAEAL